MTIKFRKFWKRNPVEQIHNIKKPKEDNLTDDDFRIYVKCLKCKEGRVTTITDLGGGRKIYGTKLCPVCHGLGEIDSGKRHKIK